MIDIDKWLQETEQLTLSEFRKIYLADPRLCKFLCIPGEKNNSIPTIKTLFDFLMSYCPGERSVGLVVLNVTIRKEEFDTMVLWSLTNGSIDSERFIRSVLNHLIDRGPSFPPSWVRVLTTDHDIVDKWILFSSKQSE